MWPTFKAIVFQTFNSDCCHIDSTVLYFDACRQWVFVLASEFRTIHFNNGKFIYLLSVRRSWTAVRLLGFGEPSTALCSVSQIYL